MEISDWQNLPRAVVNFVQLMSPVQQSSEAVLKLFCISFEAVRASCVSAVVPSTSGSAGSLRPLPRRLAKGCHIWFRANTVSLSGQKQKKSGDRIHCYQILRQTMK